MEILEAFRMFKIEVCFDLFERQSELNHGLKCPLAGMGVVAQFDGTHV
jgi:hypothetical protein